MSKIIFVDRAEVSNGRCAFRFDRGEVVDPETSEKCSTDPRSPLMLKDADLSKQLDALAKRKLVKPA